MNRTCNKRARTILCPIVEEAVDFLISKNRLLNPTAALNGVKFPRLSKYNCSIYVQIIHAVLESCGHSMNTHQRNEYFRETIGLDIDDSLTMFIVCNLDFLTKEEDLHLGKLFDRAMNTILEDDTVEVPQELKTFLRKVWREGGGELGAKKKYIAQMIELGVSNHWDMGSTAEAWACDVKEINHRKNSVVQAALKRRRATVWRIISRNTVSANCLSLEMVGPYNA